MKKLFTTTAFLLVLATVVSLSAEIAEAQYLGWGNRYNGGRSSQTSYYTYNYAGYPQYVSDQSYYSGYRYNSYYNRDPVIFKGGRYGSSYGAYATYRGSPYARQVYSGGDYYRSPKAYDSYNTYRAGYPRYGYGYGYMMSGYPTMMY